MQRSIWLVVAMVCLYACQKSSDSSPAANGIDKTKLVNKNWYWDGKHDPQWLTLHFKTNDTVTMTQCVWIVPPYQYRTTNLPWRTIGKDSIFLGGARFKVLTLSDTLLVTNNWVVAGLSDTIKQYFRTN